MQRPQSETVTLNDILITEALSQRSPRLPNWQAEAEAMRSLAQQMARDSQRLMQTLADTALELCGAGTAGVSLLETTLEGEEIFRWTVLAGALAHHVGGTTPRHFSPCGVCLDQGTPVLFSHPASYFTYFQEANIPFVEGLVLPLVADHQTLGTIWILSHDEQRQFDSEDVRIMTSLADFTATALLLQQRQTGELLAVNATLETNVEEHRQAEAQLQALIANLPGGAVFVVDRDLRYLLADGEALAIAGFKPEDLVGKTIFEVLPPDVAASYEPRYRQALAGEPFEHEHQSHNRSYVSRGTPLYSANGEVYAVLVVSYDISDRVRAEDDRKSAEQTLTADLRDTQLLHQLSTRLVSEDNIQALYQEILEAAIALTHADAGTVQILDEATQDLLLLATRGFERDLIDHFYRVNASSNTSCGRALVTSDAPTERLCQRTFIDFDVSESEDPDGSMRIHVAAGYLSAQSTPLIARSGRAIGMVSTHWRSHHRPSDRELRFLDLLARQAADLIEQRQVANALRESEARYRSLFNSIDEGFCLFEMMYDENSRVVDYRFLEVNPVFEQQTGLKNVVGKLGSEIAPNTERHWLETYDAVVKTGNPQRIENFNQATDRWYSAYASRIGDEGSRQVCTVFTDITERKRYEQRQAYLLQLSDALRSLSDAVEIHAAVTRIALNFFGADRCYYCEIMDGNAIIRRDVSREGLPSVAGIYPLSDFPIFKAVIDAGHPLVVEDAQTTDILDEALRQLCCEMQVISFIDVPVIKEGEPAGILCLTQTTPRNWTAVEMELAQETAERVWSAVERARAEGQLHRAAEMDAFRVKLSDALRSLSDAVEIQATVTRITMNFFRADRCYYCEIIDGSAVIRWDASQADLPSVVGAYPLENSPIFRTMLDAGQPFVFEDVHTTNVQDENLRQTCVQLQIIAALMIPVIKQGEPVGILCITQTTSRNWTEFEMDLAEEIADRTWATIERTRAEAALRDAELQRLGEQSAREQEQQRAETLAELDRAKTAFFSNISHEFRTPLTLSLAPLQDALKIVDEWESGRVGEWESTDDSSTHLPIHPSTHPPIPASTLKQNLELVHRNSLRLLKLVNTLLDFSRIEAGRMEAVYEPTDLATFTAELASVFRSAIERAGLQLIVDCPPIPQFVFVDREMWEKIVLNLLSNAFKFTFEGEIRVSLRVAEWQSGSRGEWERSAPSQNLTTPHPTPHTPSAPHAILQIQDTGTGIAPEHLPHLFERFYQVRGTQARTHEGSGIGLALVHELVQLHGGAIEVSSTLGAGTCFTIALPFGTDHLPSTRVASPQENRLQNEGDATMSPLRERLPNRTLASTAMGATSYVEEAERWLPANLDPPQSPLERGENAVKVPLMKGDLGGSPKSQTDIIPRSSKVLIVDDNADMREYLTRILSEYVQVEAVADGATALAIAQERTLDLILSDVMMPGLDGFELLGALRANPQTREVPIILLSARAGEEAIVEGLEAGADDYLIKPFSAQELVSRVMAHLQMAQLRGEALQQARSTLRSRDEFISVVSHELNTPLVSILGWTRMLRSSPPNPVMLSKALDTIERNATLQGKLVQDLLDLSRITAGKLRLNPQPIELKPVLETAIATVTQAATDKGVNLTWQENVKEPIVVMGDSDRLQQVICNLLTNAIKFTPESGSVTLELCVINDDHAADTSYTEIRVIDSGIGITADFLPHVFDRFRQAEGAHSVKGLGLGLAIARHLVELHNGTIHVESAGEGQGATFIVCLPLLKSSE